MRDAADAAQSAFAELFTKWSTVRSPRAWLRTVAFRQMLRQPLDYPLDAHSEPSVLPASSALEFREQEQQVLTALRGAAAGPAAGAGPGIRPVFLPEIAEITGKNEAAVRKNIERARTAMREILGVT